MTKYELAAVYKTFDIKYKHYNDALNIRDSKSFKEYQANSGILTVYTDYLYARKILKIGEK